MRYFQEPTSSSDERVELLGVPAALTSLTEKHVVSQVSEDGAEYLLFLDRMGTCLMTREPEESQWSEAYSGDPAAVLAYAEYLLDPSQLYRELEVARGETGESEQARRNAVAYLGTAFQAGTRREGLLFLGQMAFLLLAAAVGVFFSPLSWVFELLTGGSDNGNR